MSDGRSSYGQGGPAAKASEGNHIAAAGDDASSGFIETGAFAVSREFTSLQEIPSGGFNRLTKAKRYGKWFILKTLKPEFAELSFYRQLLVKEFEIASRLDHPNVVRALEWETVDGLGDCIVFEYIDGTTLEEYLSGGSGASDGGATKTNKTKTRSAKAERRRIADELIAAVAYINDLQVVHRDLKPSNIMITANGKNLKIIDFGLSDADYYDILKDPAGTAKYMSPEQLTSSTSDCKNDIYSVGKILLEINAGAAYNLAARRCCQDSAHRYSSLHDVAKDIARHRKFILLLAAIWAISIFAAVVCAATFITARNSTARQQENAIAEVIAGGQVSLDSLITGVQAVYDDAPATGTAEEFGAYIETITAANLSKSSRFQSILSRAVAPFASDETTPDTTPSTSEHRDAPFARYAKAAATAELTEYFASRDPETLPANQDKVIILRMKQLAENSLPSYMTHYQLYLDGHIAEADMLKTKDLDLFSFERTLQMLTEGYPTARRDSIRTEVFTYFRSRLISLGLPTRFNPF